METLPEGSRFEIQQSLYEMLGGEGDLFTLYQPSQAENTSVWNGEDGLTHVTRVGEGTSRLVYQVEVSGQQALYFDAFRNLSTRLEEPINGSFSIKVNGETVTQSYPSKRENGLLYLGAFQNESVTVEVELLKDVSLRSFGLAGLDVELLRQTVEQAPGVDVQVDGRHFSAQTQAGEGEFLHVAIPYDRGFTARVNGKAVAVSQVNDGFLAIPLEEGENTIEISFLPAGMKLGAAAALLGAMLLWLLLLGARPGMAVPALAPAGQPVGLWRKQGQQLLECSICFPWQFTCWRDQHAHHPKNSGLGRCFPPGPVFFMPGKLFL